MAEYFYYTYQDKPLEKIVHSAEIEHTVLIVPTYRMLSSFKQKSDHTQAVRMPKTSTIDRFFLECIEIPSGQTMANNYEELFILYQALENLDGDDPANSEISSYLEQLKEKSFYAFLGYGKKMLQAYHELADGEDSICETLQKMQEELHAHQGQAKYKLKLLEMLYPLWVEELTNRNRCSLSTLKELFHKEELTLHLLDRNITHIKIIQQVPYPKVYQKMFQSLQEKYDLQIEYHWQTTQEELAQVGFYQEHPDSRNEITEKPQIEPNKLNLNKYTTLFNEITALKGKIEEILSERKDLTLRDIGIILPDSSMISAYINYFPAQVLNVTPGMPLQKSLIFDMLKSLEFLLTETLHTDKGPFFYTRNLLHLLHSPFLRSHLIFNTEVTIHQYEETMKKLEQDLADRNLKLLFQNTEKDPLLTSISKAISQPVYNKFSSFMKLFQIKNNHTLNKGLQQIEGFISTCYESISEEMKTTQLTDCYTSFREAISTLYQLENTIELTLDQTVRVINQIFAGLTYPLSELHKGITIIGYEEAAVLDFKILFMPHMDQRFPAQPHENTFFNDMLRSANSLPNFAYSYFKQRAGFLQLIAQAEEAYISYTESDKKEFPSPLLLELQIEYPELKPRENTTETAVRLLEHPNYEILQPTEKRAETPLFEQFSPSALLTLLDCPYKQALQKARCDLAPDLSTDLAITPLEAGIFLHDDILKTLFEIRMDFDKTFPTIGHFYNKLRELLDQKSEKYPHYRYITRNYLDLQDLITHNAEAIYHHQKKHLETYSIEAAEKKYTYEKNSKKITCRIDRLDQHRQSGSLFLIDYKSSRKSSINTRLIQKKIVQNLQQANEEWTLFDYQQSLKSIGFWRHLLQMYIYRFILLNQRSADHIEGALYYFGNGHFTSMEMPNEISNQQIEPLIDLLLHYYDRHPNPESWLPDPEKFENCESPAAAWKGQAGSCMYCSFQYSCPFFRKHQQHLSEYIYQG